ncbi:DoxX family membrane protein [Winogradskyella echinorum]|uniref:DoxX family membrane protein n=1 Tax=Winogradskyella echinorum TaxID=538189 RepID=A0ABR6Y4C7_9FLAO|nr:DoxX family membrane protein [Winogradskyella echinorum]MBC3847599.1 DoxX family membrane protein [Winogradskyella echinorum]MBC5751947.1 DoxX family membrane protein [Winogradskyella echinorum]
MSPIVFMYLRIVLGILCIVFGINKFSDFLPLTELTGEAANYFNALSNAKAMPLVGITLIVSGLALILNKYGALATLILMSISVNAFLFHVVLNPSGIARTAILLALNIIVLISYRDKYKVLLT